MKPSIDTYYHLPLVNPYIEKLVSQRENGTIIGFPNSGVNHIVSRSITSLSLDDSFAVIDISICPRNSKEFIKQVGSLIKSHVQNGIKIIQINRLDLSRKYGLKQLKALNSFRNEQRRQFIYLFHLNDLPILINPEISRAEYGTQVTTNTLFYPFANLTDWPSLLETIEPKYQYHLNKQESETVFKLSGGCPHIAQVLVKKLSQGEDMDSIESVVETAKMSFAHTSRRQLSALRNLSLALPIQIDSFQRMGIIDTKLRFTSQILDQVIKGIELTSVINLDNNDTLSLNGESIESQLSPSELSILKLMAQNQFASRDDIAKLCYGQSINDEYSDYSIDKIMSRLRHRLTQLGTSKDVITTLRGRGYKLKTA